MSEALAFLSDFVAESATAVAEAGGTATESAATETTAATIPVAPDTTNLKPVDADKVAGQAKAKSPAIKFSGIKTPGTIAALLILVLFMVFAIVPTKSGKTRLQLLWAVLYKGGKLRGQASLNPHTGHGSTDTVENNSFYTPVPNSPGMYYGPGGLIVDEHGAPQEW